MTAMVRLLVVEDDEGQFDTYQDAAEEYEGDGGKIHLTLHRETNADSAKQALLSREFDAAVVDINLDKSNASEASGNDILAEIIGKHRFPVFVVSGNLGKLNQAIRDRESLFLKCYDRDKPNKELFDEIVTIYKTGITQILSGKGKLEQKLGDIFWNHLSHDLDVWFGDGYTSESALLRYTVSHLSEYLDTSTDGNRYYSDAEFYIKPPIRPYLATGDISEKDDVRYLLLSPACDISPRGQDDNGYPIINASRLILAKLIRVDRDEFLSNKIIKEGDNVGARRSAVNNIIKGKQDKYVFLPDYKDLKAAVVDLQNLHTVDYKEYLDYYARLATVSGSFLKDIQSRFSSYYGRQGHPDLDKDALQTKHANSLTG